ncbi:MAG: methyltransferase domain-containing protein [Chthoniobacterales bacterium]
MSARQFNAAEPELMDVPQPVTPELEIDLRNLRQLNRYFGGYAMIGHFLARWIRRGDKLRVLDLATGSGDVPRIVAEHARQVGARMDITAIDRQLSTIEIARRLSQDYPEIRYEHHDVLAFRSSERYDVVLCSLAVHHFSETDAVALLRRCHELSGRFLLVTDLRRGPLATLGVYLLTALLFRARMTQVDGRMSARRAFSFAEFRELAELAGWQKFHHRKFKFARQALWMEPPFF